MTQHANEYIGPDGVPVGAYPDTEQDKVYAKDPNYELVGKSSPAQAAQVADGEGSKAAEPGDGETPDTGDEAKGETTEKVDLDSLNRDGLNELAAKLEIKDAETLPNKGAVKDAIKAAQVADGEG